MSSRAGSYKLLKNGSTTTEVYKSPWLEYIKSYASGLFGNPLTYYLVQGLINATDLPFHSKYQLTKNLSYLQYGLTGYNAIQGLRQTWNMRLPDQYNLMQE